MNLPPITVESTSEAPDCPACGGPGILSAQVSHPVTHRLAVAVLCEACDIDDPDAGPLIAYFAVNGAIDSETLDQGTSLVATWLSTARAKPPR